MTHIAIIIPAYNEEKRIGRMLACYLDYFDRVRDYQKAAIKTEFIVVLNGCVDNTARVVQEVAACYANVHRIEIDQAGKGLAIAAGFRAALTLPGVDLIGFVDADMATQPQYFHDLIRERGNHKGIIASRYMPGAWVYPARPWVKRVGSRLIYDSLVTLLFGMRYYDVQCGAKLFTREVVAAMVPHLQVRQWSFDVEILYLCKLLGFAIKEHPTTWYDQADSKLSIVRDGLRMPMSLVKIRLHHARFSVLYNKRD